MQTFTDLKCIYAVLQYRYLCWLLILRNHWNELKYCMNCLIEIMMISARTSLVDRMNKLWRYRYKYALCCSEHICQIEKLYITTVKIKTTWFIKVAFLPCDINLNITMKSIISLMCNTINIVYHWFLACFYTNIRCYFYSDIFIKFNLHI